MLEWVSNSPFVGAIGMFVLALRAGDDKPIASKTLDKVLFIGFSKRVFVCMCDVVGEYKSNQMVCSAKAWEVFSA